MMSSVKMRALCTALLLALTLTACTAGGHATPAPTAPASSEPAASTPAGSTSTASTRALSTSPSHTAKLEEDPETSPVAKKYTRDDYTLLESLHTKDWEKLTLAAFNAGFHAGDEDGFHKAESALDRLFASLPKKDPLYTFLNTTVSYSWDACRRQHYYQSCVRSDRPANTDRAECKLYKDVYGDKVPVAHGSCDFWYDYTIPDEAAITVKERDAFFLGLEEGMQAFLSAQKENAFKRGKPTILEHALGLELQRLTGVLGSDQIYATTCGVSYGVEWLYR